MKIKFWILVVIIYKVTGNVSCKFKSYRGSIFVVRKSYKTQKAQDLVGLVLFCCYILWFAPFAEYLNLGAAF